MQKVYLLLRNNQQTGPYTFEQLLQLQLKPQDLIWIEGKSYGWRYPAEVENLKPYVATVDFPKGPAQVPSKATDAPAATVNPKKVFVSMPVNSQQQVRENTVPIDSIEQKAEELRRRAQAYAPQKEEIKTNYSRNLNDAEENYTKWIYERKTKNKSVLSKKTLVIAGIGALILLSGWWVKGHFFNELSIANITTTAQKNITPEAGDSTTNKDLIAEEQNTSIKKINSKLKVEKTKKDKVNLAAEKVMAQKETPVSETVAPQDQQAVEQTTNNNSEERNDETIAQAPTEKKKTLRGKLGDIFKKKEDTPEEPQAADNTNNERKATRREEENTSVSVTDVSELVDLKTNKIADSWMMGVKNVKLILYNRSNLTINAAKVEVLYYSDQNNLLEKKIISYANIPPKKSQAVSIPDNRLADHIDYKVVSATGIENAYATR